MGNHYQRSPEEPAGRTPPVPIGVVNPAHAERHYAVTEVAALWNLSSDKVRDLFQNEPGVLVIGERSPRHKRRYMTLRIPQSVLERVHSRLSSKSFAW
jgi:hypothetical protein